MSCGGNGITGGDYIAVQNIGGGNLHGSGCNDGIQFLFADLFLLGGNGLKSFVNLAAVLFGKIVTKALHGLQNSSLIIMSGQVDAAVHLYTIVKGGSLSPDSLAHPGNLINNTAQLGNLNRGCRIEAITACSNDSGDVGKGRGHDRISRCLDFIRTMTDCCDGAGISHSQRVGAGDAEGDFFKCAYRREEVIDKCTEFLGHHRTGGITNRDCGCAVTRLKTTTN